MEAGLGGGKEPGLLGRKGEIWPAQKRESKEGASKRKEGARRESRAQKKKKKRGKRRRGVGLQLGSCAGPGEEEMREETRGKGWACSAWAADWADSYASFLNQLLVMTQSDFDSTFSFFFKQFIYSSNFSNSYKTNKTILKYQINNLFQANIR